VVCDDGSTDATLEILQAFRLQAPFSVHIYRNETNLGYIRNFEKAVSLSTGDITFLCDQDDVWLATKIERIENEFKTHKAAWVIVNDAELVLDDLAPTGLTVASQLLNAGIGVEQLLLGCCIAFRSELKPLVFPIPHHIHGHDGWINTLGNALRVRHFLPEILQSYRRHGTNTSASLTTCTKPATRWHLLMEKLKWENVKKAPCAASGRRLEQLNVLIDRLKTHEDYLLNSLQHGLPLRELLSDLDQERNANETRRALQQLSFVGRTVAGLRFYLAGGYRQFDGLKSLARDILQ
jgi:hypothetical protein